MSSDERESMIGRGFGVCEGWESTVERGFGVREGQKGFTCLRCLLSVP